MGHREGRGSPGGGLAGLVSHTTPDTDLVACIELGVFLDWRLWLCITIATRLALPQPEPLVGRLARQHRVQHGLHLRHGRVKFVSTCGSVGLMLVAAVQAGPQGLRIHQQRDAEVP